MARSGHGFAIRLNLWSCGGEGNRTPGLFDATEALYQLSYTPELGDRRIYLWCCAYPLG